MTDLAARLNALSPDQRKLILNRLREQEAPAAPSPRPARLPLSFGQQRLWLLDQIDGGSAHYNECGALQIDGRLDVLALRQTLAEVVRRHEVLRTCFQPENGTPYQVISAPGPVSWRLMDLRDLEEDEQEEEVAGVIQDEARKPFDLTNGPLLRFALLQLGSESHLLVFSVHHIVFDRWSAAIFWREVVLLYRAFSAGAPSPLPPLAYQYADYAIEQRVRLSDVELDRDLDYWRAQLAGAPTLLQLPTDHLRPPVQDFRGRRIRFDFGPELSAQIRAFGQQTGSTPFMTLLAGYAALLARYSRQQEVLIGAPIANRPDRRTETLIGFLVNTLVLRTDLAGNPTFTELVRRCRSGALAAYGHAETPFERLVEALQPERSLSHTPLFQATLTLQNAPAEYLDVPELRIRERAVEQVTAKFDLALHVEEAAGEFLPAFEYSVALFEAATIARMGRHLANLLRAAIGDPERPVRDLSLMDASELSQVLDHAHGIEVAPPAGHLAAAFEEQVQLRPKGVALLLGEESLTYAELNRRANCLAHGLRKCGVGPDALVGVFLERSFELIVALVAIAKAGGAYLALDPQAPDERLALILAEANAPVLLTSARLRARLPNVGCEIWEIDGPPGESEKEDAANLCGAGCGGRNLAYVSYTSGSTGEPKGVMIEHRSVLRLVKKCSYARITTEDVFLQMAPVCFDASTFEIWGALLNGAQLAIVPPGLPSLAQLGEAIRRHRVTILWLTTGLFHSVVDACLEDLRSVRQVLFGGDVASAAHVSRAAAALSSGRLIHAYGPTENTTFTSCQIIRPGDATVGAHVPIGVPIDHSTIYLLDEALQPTPVGVPGELYCGGIGVARGYLRRPEMTAESFIPDPFDRAGGGRLYRSGDLCRWRADGMLEFLGRTDQQVKIRGFRIELGEIEAALLAHTRIKDAVVTVEAGSASKRLIAYVVRRASNDLSTTPEALRTFLAKKLPPYMVPAIFMELDALPLNANGKVERSALPKPLSAPLETEHPARAPRTVVEELVAGVWADVLKVSRVSANDNFFDLGGQSLLAMITVARLGQAFGTVLPVTEIFDAPTVAELSARIEEARGNGTPGAVFAISRRTGAHAPRLSFAQERLWLLGQLEGPSATYNVSIVLRLRGALDVEAFESAWREILRRHEVLRCRIVAENGTPVQVLETEAAFALARHDLAALLGEEQSAEAHRVLLAETQRPFDLSTGPLLRTLLLRLAPEEHLFALTLHHIVSDAWSLGVLVREFSAIYAAFTRSEESPLPELPLQFADFAEAQREHLQGEVLAAELAYWEPQLAGPLPTLALPLDRSRPPVQDFRGSAVYFDLGAERTWRLEQLSRRSEATLFMTLYTAFVTLLHRYTGQNDMVVGSPIANRTSPEVEPLLGFFVNTLALRSNLEGDPTFRELLRRTREMTLQAYAHQSLPFAKLVEVVAPERSLTHSPLFQVMFGLQNAAIGTLELPGLSAELIPLEDFSAKYDLTLTFEPMGETLRGRLEFSTALFQRETIERMAGHFVNLVEALVEAPHEPISKLSLLSAPERALLLEEWSGAPAAEPEEEMMALFAAQVSQRPGAPAVIGEDETLTYAELDRRAELLAERLRRRRLEPEARVGVYARRTPAMVVTLLGILKAGGTYLALDPQAPEKRLHGLLEDAGCTIAIAPRELADRFPSGFKGEVLLLDEIDGPLDGSGSSTTGQAERGDARRRLAYVCYTSGSTGLPKGVLVERCAIVRLVRQAKYVVLGPESRLLQTGALAFDASTFEIWGALLNGGAVCLPPGDDFLDAAALGPLLARHRITHMFLTTALFHALADSDASVFGGTLGTLLVGGERSSAAHFRRVREAHPRLFLKHVYGPTENTTFTTAYDVATVPADAVDIPIGHPISGTTVYLLDPQLQPVPTGVAGELYCGGEGVARGYLGRAELTAGCFVPDPFSQRPGARLYRSGDLCRWKSDGAIEFLSRADDQLKIRGYRIEPGEIEAVLRAQPGVQEAVVIPWLDEAGGCAARLVGYLVRSGGEALETVREELGSMLPDYMVPAVLIELPALPLNAHGKIDRARLPRPELPALAGEYLAPRAGLEETLAAIWTEVLGIERIGRHDNFFALGGHSLLATQLASRLRLSFAVEFPLRRLFEHPTVASLAECITSLQLEASLRVEPVLPGARKAESPLSFAQERLWILNELEPNNPFYNVSSILRLKGLLEAAVAERVLMEVIRRHEVLRARFVSVDGSPVQIIAEDGGFQLALTDLQGERDAPAVVDRLAQEELRRPFDLRRGPLVRATLLRLAPNEHILLLTMHHIISDGWSMGVLTHEMAELYEAFSRGLASPLGELTIQYADFTRWQRARLSGEVLERQLTYWRRQLAGAPPVLKLPTDRPRPVTQSFRGDSHSFDVDAASTAALRRLSERSAATLFMTLQAAFAALLSRYSSQEDIVMGSPVANRTRVEIEPLIGFFVNTLTLRTDLSGDPPFEELLRRVRQCALDAYAHEELPFERLVDELQPERDLSRNPLFQVMFALQNAPARMREVPGLTMEPVRQRRVAAQFDLVLDIWEAGPVLHAVLEYSTDLFETATIERMAGHFQTLLAAVAAEPGQRLSQLPWLTGAERRQLLTDFNGPRLETPHERCLHELFAGQVAASPGRICAVHRGERLTYAALDARANRISRVLRRAGAGLGTFVGILEERGLDFLAAMLGILKAGAAFVPLDPSYPADRVRYIVADSELAILVTRGAHWEKFGLDRDLPHLRAVLRLDGAAAPGGKMQVFDPAELGTEDDAPLPLSNTSRDVAYLLYTSGSTGLPKGALIRHDGAVNHIFAEFHELRFHHDTAFLQSAPSSSDISVWQFLAAPLIGGRTVIADFETVCEPAQLHALIRSEDITLIELVPVLMQQLLDFVEGVAAERRTLPSLEWAMVTGEAVPVSLANQWLTAYPHIPLVNAYGPTEAADDVCQSVLRSPLPLDAATVPIGRAIGNLSLYVLDVRLHLVPIGVPGEICVSGIGVGAGYWKRPEQTQASFVPNPHAGPGHGDTLYRTGDLGRWLPGGELEMVGRLDQQVKLRGFRIELGEIESAVAQHFAVREAVALLRGDRAGESRLAAYLTLHQSVVAHRVVALQKEQVARWHDLHQQSYTETLDGGDPTFDVIGWDSNYTGQPLSRLEMEEYVGHTVDAVLAVGPKRVLEIGCGTGLLLFRIAPHCERYVGTDLSGVVIGRLSAVAQARGDLGHVELHTCRADELTMLEPGSFDTVLLSSVVQYFPTIDYLLEVIETVIPLVRAGGTIFLRDVRSLPLLEAFHASVQFFKAPDEMEASQLRRRIRRQLVQEQELAIDPAFFTALQERLPRMSGVAIEPKRGSQHNEMTRFRYDVTLRLDVEAAPTGPIPLVDWSAEIFSAADIRRRLAEEQPESLGLRAIANPRIASELAAMAWLTDAAATESIGDFRGTMAQCREIGLDPDALRGVASDLPYDVFLSCALDRDDGSYDAIFTRRDGTVAARPPFPSGAKPRADWSAYSNQPLDNQAASEFTGEVRAFLKEKLPAYMVPADLVVLPAFPLLPSGKIDREGLPVPEAPLGGRDDAAPPSTPMEEALAGIWAELLGVDRPGIRDNFFELGGHSLKATQLVNSILARLGVQIALRDVFLHPTIAELACVVAAHRPAASGWIQRTPVAPDYPMSHAQQRIWVLSQTPEGSAAYHMPAALLLSGPFDPQALADCFQALIERHESLRTTFFIDALGEPRQRVHPDLDAHLAIIDVSHFSDPVEEARRRAGEDVRMPFDLEKGPLARMSLLHLGEDRWVLLTSMHHSISDDWSFGVLVRELKRLWQGRCLGAMPALPPLPLQYRDFAASQRHMLQGDSAQVHRRYWHEKLSGEIPVIDLPTDFPRPAVKSYGGSMVRFRISRTLTDSLLSLAAARGATLFMMLVAVVKTLLHRHTNQEDIIVGFPIAGRNYACLEDQIGFYVNTLPLRDRVTRTMPFLALLEQVRQTATEAYEHQDYPFDLLVNELDLPRDVSRSPLFDVMVVEQNVDPYRLELEGIRIEPFFEEFPVSKFDLAFHFSKGVDQIDALIAFNPAIFLEERIQRMSRQFRELVAAIVASPNQPLGLLNLLPAEERQHVLQDFNPAPAPTPSESIVSWFKRQATLRRDGIAITGESRNMSYRELDERSEWLARYLQKVGVRPNALVGIYAQRSPDLVVAMLGILKAGATYVPLDPLQPGERCALMLADAQLAALITESGMAARLPSHDAPTILLDAQWPDVIAQEGEPLPEPQPGDGAYVIYTSGSTGTPKGVLVSHENVVRLFTATERWFHFGVEDVWTFYHSAAFDFSVWEIWGALLYGGRLVVVPHSVSRAPEDFHELLAREGVTVLNQTPSAFRLLTDAVQASPRPLCLRTVIFGGEALDCRHLQPWFDLPTGSVPRMVNMYGITETTVHVTYREITAADAGSSVSAIGCPIPDLCVYLVDPDLNPAPFGVPGEICVGGAGLASGYLRRPELTAERFIPDPFGGLAGARLYRSGDLARYLPNGELEYLGRMDQQVKIRGFRIELGEIEAVLTAHPSVAAAHVVLREFPSGDRYLVGYVVLAPSEKPDELREFLKGRLPEYMVPARLVKVPGFPLTPNGKIDRRALAALEDTAIDEGPAAVHTPPRDEIERTVAGVWAEVLQIPIRGIDDNFFDLGGHSVLLILAHRKLRERLDREIPILEMFRYPTLRSFCEHLSRTEPESDVALSAAEDSARRQREVRQRRQRGPHQPGQN